MPHAEAEEHNGIERGARGHRDTRDRKGYTGADRDKERHDWTGRGTDAAHTIRQKVAQGHRAMQRGTREREKVARSARKLDWIMRCGNA